MTLDWDRFQLRSSHRYIGCCWTQVALARRQRRDLSVLESSCHLPHLSTTHGGGFTLSLLNVEDKLWLSIVGLNFIETSSSRLLVSSRPLVQSGVGSSAGLRWSFFASSHSRDGDYKQPKLQWNAFPGIPEGDRDRDYRRQRMGTGWDILRQTLAAGVERIREAGEKDDQPDHHHQRRR